MSANRVIILWFVASLSGCAISSIRQLTYPDNIVYIDKNQLHTVMHRMAAEIRLLDVLLADQPIEPDRHSQVVGNLERLDQIIAELSVEGVTTNHTVIDEHLGEFRADVARARLMVSANPPNYYWAGRLTGSCSACHQFR